MIAKPILVLDFDGVVCDSTEECVVSAWNAWLSHSGWRPSARVADDVPEPYRSGMRQLRSYVRTAGEYFILLETLRINDTIHSEDDYGRLTRYHKKDIEPFGELFFKARRQLQMDDEAHWLQLHHVYDGIPAAIRSIVNRFALNVVTGRDRDSVQLFFNRFEIALDRTQVHDKNAAVNKLDTIRTIASSRHQPLSSVVFLDDNVHHLLPAAQAGCHALMAGWGYHTDEQVEKAEIHRIPIVTLESWVDAALAEVH